MHNTLALLDPTKFVSSSGYIAIFILSVLQSCCVPTSSELTLGFGGVLASQGTLSLPGVILAGALGETVGGYIAWAVGRVGGRPFVERYGRYVLVSTHDLDRAEAWYGRHQRFGVLGSRLLPVIRNFVAVPAGVANVPAVRFGVLTAIGSLIWDGAMALIGYAIGGQYKTVMKGFSDAGYLLGALAAVAIAFVVWHRWRSFRAAEAANPRGNSRAGAGAHASALFDQDGSTAATASGATPARRGRPHNYEAAARLERFQVGRAPAPVSSRRAALKVPLRITAVFWAVKLLSTAAGEAFSDALVHGINQYLAVMAGFVLFAFAMYLQLRSRRYSPWTYWFAVAMVAVFGTMAADVLHIGLHVPYAASTVFYAVAVAVIFAAWYRSEGTLSIHSITTPRREVYYWLAVLATFALGTALGDLTGTTSLGYLGSGILYAVLFALPGLAWAAGRLGDIAAFWVAYVLTRPLGASFADWLGFPRSAGGIGLGHVVTTVLFGLPIVALVAYISASGIDAPRPVRRRYALETEYAD